MHQNTAKNRICRDRISAGIFSSLLVSLVSRSAILARTAVAPSARKID